MPLASKTIGKCSPAEVFTAAALSPPSAIAGIDQALWDIAGKAHGVPVHDLLGGAVRDRIRMYGWVGGDEPSELRDNIAQQVEWAYRDKDEWQAGG